jgi:hypothetical protein
LPLLDDDFRFGSRSFSFAKNRQSFASYARATVGFLTPRIVAATRSESL